MTTEALVRDAFGGDHPGLTPPDDGLNRLLQLKEARDEARRVADEAAREGCSSEQQRQLDAAAAAAAELYAEERERVWAAARKQQEKGTPASVAARRLRAEREAAENAPEFMAAAGGDEALAASLAHGVAMSMTGDALSEARWERARQLAPQLLQKEDGGIKGVEQLWFAERLAFNFLGSPESSARAGMWLACASASNLFAVDNAPINCLQWHKLRMWCECPHRRSGLTSCLC
jgi:hypothetical protein